jgi:hypothetical protein
MGNPATNITNILQGFLSFIGMPVDIIEVQYAIGGSNVKITAAQYLRTIIANV